MLLDLHRASLTVIALLLAMTACAKKKGPRFWCADFGPCFVSKQSCQETLSAVGATDSCVPQETAFCKLACTQVQGGAPVCREACAVDEASCDEVESMSSVLCQRRMPPSTTDLFPYYSEPGWWCRRGEGPMGEVSHCVKGKEQCNWYVAATQAVVEQAQSPCEAREAVSCFTAQIQGDLEYQCAASETDCNTLLQASQEAASASPSPMTDFSACQAWKYSAEAKSRAVTRPPKPGGPGLRLRFRVLPDNPDPIRSVKMMRERIGDVGVEKAEVRLRDPEIEVFLPGVEAELEEQLVSILTREASWSAHRLDANASVALDLARVAKSAAGALTQHIEIASDDAGAPYLITKDRKVRFSIAEAKARDCWHEHKYATGGEVECVVTGREVLEDFVREYLASEMPSELGTPSDHLFAFEHTSAGWRSHYLKATPIVDSGDLQWALPGWDPHEDGPTVELRWNESSENRVQKARTLGSPMAILFVDLHPVVHGTVTMYTTPLGNDALLVIPSSKNASETEQSLANEDLVSVLRAGLPMGVAFQSSSATAP